ncbi:hypothetical protein JCM3263A_31450 [Thermobifida fusca]|jgi:hypothetical protein
MAVNTGPGLALAFVLCLPWVRAVVRPLVEPDASWLLRPSAAERSRAVERSSGSTVRRGR